MAPSREAKRKKFLFLVFLLMCVGVPFFISEERLTIFHSKPVHLVFVGDVMLSRQIGKIIDARGPMFPFEKLGDTIRKADIAFANLENPVSTRGTDQGSIYSFRAKPETLQGLSNAGFNIVSIANNHMFDWGSDAFVDTMTHLTSYDIDFVGGGINQEDAHKLSRIEIGRESFCFLGFTQFAPRNPQQESPGMAYLDKEKVVELITEAKEGDCDAIIVSIHWGNEYETSSSERDKVLARSFIDAGALLVIGHHPHVLQEVEEYNGGLIAYSLGNFIFDQNFSEDTRKSAILNVFVEGGRITSSFVSPIRFTKEFQPYLEEGI